MQIARSLDEVHAQDGARQPAVVTIGNFDGVHCGHQAVIRSLIERAHALGARSVVVTFDPHPARVLQPANCPRLITPLPRKLELLAATGVDCTLVLPFDDAVRVLSPRSFAEQVLHDTLHAVEVHEGETFRFGHRAEADIAGLGQLGQEFGFRVHAYQPVQKRGAAVSSSRIRTLLAAGDLATATACLGRAFSVDSSPAPGRGYGTRYAVPTVNLAPYLELLPANGVYVTLLDIGKGAETHSFRGVTNAGNRPTFGADSFAVETHLFDFQPLTLTETTPLRLTFLKRLREERRFSSPEALREQIGRDVGTAQRFLRLRDRLHGQQ